MECLNSAHLNTTTRHQTRAGIHAPELVGPMTKWLGAAREPNRKALKFFEIFGPYLLGPSGVRIKRCVDPCKRDCYK